MVSTSSTNGKPARGAGIALAMVAVAAILGCASTTSDPTPLPDGYDPAAPGPIVAFYGDSYTLGTGASDPSKRWSSIICAQRGWNEFNPSVNGLGFVQNRGDLDLPGQIIAQKPEIVFVTMGLNDNFIFPRDSIRTAIDADLQRLKSGLPDARFLVVEPFWYADDRPESVETIIGWVHDAADDIGADWIPDASHWIEGHPEWMADDGLHPNDDGYAEMAERMDAALTAAGLPPQ